MEFYRTTPRHDLTYSDVFLVPSRSGVTSRLDVSLAPDDGSGASVPIVSANMNSITGPRLAATLARRGGLGVLPQDLHLQELDDAIRWVKAQSPRSSATKPAAPFPLLNPTSYRPESAIRHNPHTHTQVHNQTPPSDSSSTDMR